MKPVLVCLLILVLSASTLRAAASEDARLRAVYKAYLEAAFRRRAVEPTRLGDHRFAHHPDDISPAARAGWSEHYLRTLNDLAKKIDYKKLPRSAQIDWELFKHHLTP